MSAGADHGVLFAGAWVEACAFVADLDAAWAAEKAGGSLHDGLCGDDVAYTAVHPRYGETGLCVAHTAHVRGCPDCGGWVVSVRTVAR